MNGNGTDPTQGIARDRWQRILDKALYMRNQNPNDMTAHDAIRQAEAALAHYETNQPFAQEGLMPHSEKAAAYAGSALQSLGQIPANLVRSGADIIEGVMPDRLPQGSTQMVQGGLPGALRAGAKAIDPMTYVQPETRQALAATQADEPAMTLAGSITGNLLPAGPSMVRGAVSAVEGGVKGIGSLLRSLIGKGAAEAAPEAAEATGEAAQAGAAGASPAGAVKPSGQATAGYGGNPRGVDFTGNGPALKSISPADEALASMKQNPWEQTAEAIKRQKGVSSLDEIINRNAQPGGLDTGNLTNQPTPQFDEGLPAARTSTLPQATDEDISQYLKQLQKALSEGYGPTPFKGGFR